MVDFLSLTLFPALMIIAGAGDALSLRIPNWLTGGIVLLFFPMALLTGMPLQDVGLHVLAGFGVLVAGFVIFSVGLFGAGDAKLLAAAGLWLGWPDLLPFLLLSALAGGIVGLCIAAWALINQHSEIHDGAIFRRLGALKPSVPYGYAFAIGAILAFPESWWMTSAGF